jgi:hypothetical protein
MSGKLQFCCILLPILISDFSCTNQRTYEGIYTWGPEVETFSPCGMGSKAWWVVTDESLSHQLSGAHETLTSKPYEGIYVRVAGSFDGNANEKMAAFAAQY